MVDLGWRQGSALDDVVGTPACLGSRVGALATGDIEDVEFTASGGLNSVLNSGIVRDIYQIIPCLEGVPSRKFLAPIRNPETKL